jgi:hypothetical protein
MSADAEIPVDRIQERLLPYADAFMVLMYSRPPSGTLRTTRVTLATILLGLAVGIFVGLPGIFLAGYGLAKFRPLWLLPAALCIAIGAGAAIVAVFGIRQRILISRQS